MAKREVFNRKAPVIEGIDGEQMIDIEGLRCDAQLLRDLNLTPGVVHRVATALFINAQGRDLLDHTRAELILKWTSPKTHEDTALLFQAVKRILNKRP